MADDVKPTVKSDEAWKERVKSEDAKLDAGRQPVPETVSAASTGEAVPTPQPAATSPPGPQSKVPWQLPPPNFAMLVFDALDPRR